MKTTVRYHHPCGSIIWVNLRPGVQAAISGSARAVPLINRYNREGAMPTYEAGDYIKAELKDASEGIGEWLWVRVESCHDGKRLVFGALDNEPIGNYGRRACHAGRILDFESYLFEVLASVEDVFQ